jgi:hypothetical protein
MLPPGNVGLNTVSAAAKLVVEINKKEKMSAIHCNSPVKIDEPQNYRRLVKIGFYSGDVNERGIARNPMTFYPAGVFHIAHMPHTRRFFPNLMEELQVKHIGVSTTAISCSTKEQR